ncbi:MAG: hypothetical protein GY953_25780, partial [bacterium]|nr:hypothetical protein [bacterium]
MTRMEFIKMSGVAAGAAASACAPDKPPAPAPNQSTRGPLQFDFSRAMGEAELAAYIRRKLPVFETLGELAAQRAGVMGWLDPMTA